MDQVVLQRRVRSVDVRIGQIAGQSGVVIPQGRAQQQGSNTVDPKLAPGQIARVPIIKTVRSARTADRVPVMVKHGEHVAMLQGARPALLEGDRRGNLELRLSNGLGCPRLVCQGIDRHVHSKQ
jgi:hypothetical protein